MACTNLTTYLAENGLSTLGAVAQASAAYDPERAQGLALAAGSEPAGFYGFGPTDEAFAALFDALNTTAEYMLGPDGISTTNDVLNYHGHLPFESNYLEDISWDNTTVYGACNNATILSKSDLCSGEGRVIDAVLLPKEFC